MIRPRVQWLEVLDQVVAVQLLAIGNELAGDGWDSESIHELLDSLCGYLADHICTTTAMAADTWAATR